MQSINLGHLTITSIDQTNKQLKFNLKVDASAEDVNSPCVRKQIKLHIKAGQEYLVNEGFVDKNLTEEWATKVALETLSGN
jgi:hypothetical protein